MSIESVRTETLTILRSVIVEPTVAVLDVPTYRNFGDSFIFLGELEYLKELGIQPQYLSDFARWDRAEQQRRCPEGPLLLQGGGNFGDRWRIFQDFREHIILSNPDRRIIQLPQSIEFHDFEAISRCKRVFESHSNLTILLRDHWSVARAKELFPNTDIRFCPDMAIGMKPAKHQAIGRDSVFTLRRTDSEVGIGSNATANHVASKREVDDWRASGTNPLRWSVSRLPGIIQARTRHAGLISDLTQKAYTWQARLNLEAAEIQLAKADIIHTDRLHAAVLGVLRGQKVRVVNNANGKIKNAFEAYLSDLGDIELYESWRELENAEN